MGILPLHGRDRHLRPKQHQHPRGHKRHRSQPIPRHRRPPRRKRRALPPPSLPAATPSYRLASAIPLPPSPVYRRVPGAVDAEPLPRARLRGGHLLLLRWHRVRRLRHPRAFLKDAITASPAADCEFHILRPAALSPGSMSTTPTPPL
ncbi:hypothetical protein V493_06397 [Pseudogymnoascus sp. VKM F-4281 (FW-2241)]|nr:hypothetical protein V493_06397 [Pseudogymnoascus sp. VKM F-4281 (FW-2241)]